MKKLSENFFANRYKEKEDLHNRLLGATKKDLFKDISGVVVEIGPGNGENFKYYPKNIEWIGIEPSEPMIELLIKTISKYPEIHSEIKKSTAEKISLPDSTADYVVGTKVLCSSKEPQQVLNEIKRILKNGGKYVFIEHVAAPKGTILNFFQNLFNPLNRIFAGNCRINRNTEYLIKNLGFFSVKIYKLNFFQKIPIFWTLLPHIYGVAKK